MKKAVIIHGTKGSFKGNWFPSVAKALEDEGYRVSVPQFPTPEGQSLENWLRHFESEVGPLDPHSLLIGHSVGAVFVLRLLERQKVPIDTAVIVAGFTGSIGLPEFDCLNASFIEAPFNWDEIRSKAKNIICLNGDRDPYVPFEQGQEIADSLGIGNIIVERGGHLNAEFGFTSFPRLLEEVTKARACTIKSANVSKGR